MKRLEIPAENYKKVAATFNPVSFNADEWVSMAKKTGMKYIIITSRHHDGFAYKCCFKQSVKRII
jgi:alpha-L-fucosidase